MGVHELKLSDTKNYPARYKYEQGEAVEQDIVSHLDQVAEKIASHLKSTEAGFSCKLPNTLELMAKLHDMGKCNDVFKEYLQNKFFPLVEEGDWDDGSEEQGKQKRIHHSTAGAEYIMDIAEMFRKNIDPKDKKKQEFFLQVAEFIAMCVMSHHVTLSDFNNRRKSDFGYRLEHEKDEKHIADSKKNFDQYYKQTYIFEKFNKSCKEFFDVFKTIEASLKKNGVVDREDKKDVPKTAKLFMLHFLFKHSLSLLVDADCLDASEFSIYGNREDHWKHDPSKSFANARRMFEDGQKHLEEKINEFKSRNLGDDEGKKRIFIERSRISDECKQFAEKHVGSFIATFSVPTGSGKTLASARFAFAHALKSNKKRIIYVVPFNTITEQNSEVLSDLFGDAFKSSLLECHSNADEKKALELLEKKYEGKNLPVQKIYREMTVRWDAPVICTSMVQLLNAFYKTNQHKNIRRLHALDDSIIIFDEIQSIPPRLIHLFCFAVNYLKLFCNTTVLLCTATQPVLTSESLTYKAMVDGEIIEGKDLEQVYDAFRRVRIHWNPSSMSNDEIAKKVMALEEKRGDCLLIMNTTSSARDVASQIMFEEENKKDKTPCYYLSTKMCPKHRQKTLQKVKEHLDPEKKENVILVSTQLIEAGVDIDFSTVVRTMASLQSISQASGRCNREGSLDYGEVYIVDAGEEKIEMLEDIRIGKNTTNAFLKKYCNANGIPWKPADKTETFDLAGILEPKSIKDYYQMLWEGYKNESGDNCFDYPVKLQDVDTTHVSLLSTNNKLKVQGYQWTQWFRTSAENFEVIENDNISLVIPYDEEAEKIIDRLTRNGERFASGDIPKEEKSAYIADLKALQPYVINIWEKEKDALENNHAVETLWDGSLVLKDKQYYSESLGFFIEK